MKNVHTIYEHGLKKQWQVSDKVYYDAGRGTAPDARLSLAKELGMKCHMRHLCVTQRLQLIFTSSSF